MDETLFYVFGIGLAVSAVVFSFAALKAKDSFPGKAFPIIMIWFLVLAAGAATFSVLHAKEEQEHKAKEFEQAGEEIEAEEGSQHEERMESGEEPQEEEPAGSEEEEEGEEMEAGGEEAEGNEANPTEEEGGATGATGAGGEVKLAADESALLYDTDSLESSAGRVKIDFNNPSSIPHDVAVEDDAGDELGKTEIISQSEESTEIELEAGTYTFFCTVPGHREAGMEGTLTVK